MQKIPFIVLLFFSLIAFPQGDISVNSAYPTNYFRKPLDIPILLSGTFGELRTNHFHAGLDIKTQQVEGLNVYSAAQGYVSRIKISHWGYGKALYITHPNGYTSVYAHLKKFNKRIDFFQNIIEEREKAEDVQEELDKLQVEREEAEKELEELKQILEEQG